MAFAHNTNVPAQIMTNTKKPFFSIIIPSFNPKIGLLADCLQSVEAQSCNQWEIIVVDAQSPRSDAVKLECSRIKRASFLLDIEASGVYAAINQAIRVSKGDWILVLGHDDRLATNFVLEQAKVLIMKKRFAWWRQGHYGSVLVDGDAGWANDGEIYGGKFSFADLCVGNICHQAVFYRGTSARMKGREYSREFRVTSDWDYNIRAWTRGGMGYLPMVVSIFKGGGLSASSEFDGFHGGEALAFDYWKRRRPYLFALVTLAFCRFTLQCARIKKSARVTVSRYKAGVLRKGLWEHLANRNS